MLESSSPFIQQLRKGVIAAPGTRRFTSDQWRADYAEHGIGSAEDRRVFEAGLWAGEQLIQLWLQVDRLGLAEYRFDELVAALMRVASGRVAEIFQPELSSPKSLTIDHHLTALGDALWRALALLYAQRDAMTGSANVPAGLPLQLLGLCASIYVVEFFMGRVTYCGWESEEASHAVIFKPASDAVAFAANEAIGMSMRNDLVQEFCHTYQASWDVGKLRGEAPEHFRLTNRTGTRASFRVVAQPPVTMPSTLPLFAMELPDWMQPILTTKPEGLNGLSVVEIIQTWMLLQQVFRRIFEREMRDHYGKAEFTCELRTSDLLTVFRMRNVSEQHSAALLKFFTFDGRRHERLWAAPLVQVGDVLHPFLPSILAPNLSRMVDLWLKECRVAVSKGKTDTLVRRRGLAFEGYVRKTIGEHLASGKFGDAHVCRDSITIGGSEIDLLWRIGSVVFVADVKFNKFPANPNEIGNYYRELEHGAEQAKLRVSVLDRNRGAAAKAVGWTNVDEQLSFVPMVVCGHPIGSGMKFNGVPCVDFDSIEMVLREDGHIAYGTVTASGISAGLVMRFLKEPTAFANFLKFYVERPSNVFLREPVTSPTLVESVRLDSGQRVAFVNYSANLPSGTELARYAKIQVDRWESLLDEIASNAGVTPA